MSPDDVDKRATAFGDDIVDAAAQQRLPDLFRSEHPDVLYRERDRHGVTVIGLRTSALSERQLLQILRYRLAQYLALGFLDVRSIYAAGMTHELLSGVAADDVHIVAGSAETGELLCYLALRAIPDAPANATLRTHDRPLLPVEKVFGWGVYNRLRILPDLPLNRLRELGRFVKTSRGRRATTSSSGLR